MAKPARDLTGETYGRLTVISRTETPPTVKKDSPDTYWKCQCACGAVKVVEGRSLRVGTTISCGCYNRELTRKTAAEKALKSVPGEAGFQALLTSYRGRAKKSGQAFMLTEDQFRELVTGDCYVCGSPPSRSMTSGHSSLAREIAQFQYNGVDRWFSSLGYTPDNSRSCCAECNIAKNDMEPSEFQEWLRRVFRHQLKKHAAFLFGTAAATKVIAKLVSLVEGEMTFPKGLLIALAAHGNTEDKGKNPYILHVIRVALGMETDDEKIPAVLHDTIEDSDFTLQDLSDLGCTRSQVKIVEAVTKTSDYDHEKYLSNIELSPVATEIKILDMEDNCRLDRMKSVPLLEKHMTKFNQYLVDLRRLKGYRRRK